MNACAIIEQVLLITVVIAPAHMQEAIEGNNLISIMNIFSIRIGKGIIGLLIRDYLDSPDAKDSSLNLRFSSL